MDGGGVANRIRLVALRVLRECRRCSLPGNDCLGHAVTFVEAVKRERLPRCILQAGSANFPRFQTGVRIAAEESTHFSYEWTLDGRVLDLLSQRRMPELHCWVAFPGEELIVDLTSGYQGDICRTMLGVSFLNPSIPRVVVDSPENLNLLRIYYRAELLPCLLVEALRQDLLGNTEPLKKWTSAARAIIEKG